MMDDRREFLFKLLGNLEQAHQEWSDDETPGLPRDGAFWVSCDEVVDGFSVDEGMPPGMRGVMRGVEELSSLWAEYKSHAVLTSDLTMIPGAKFWKCFESLFESLDQSGPKKPKVLESIETLDNQKVNDNLIAKIYGWYTEHGAPDLERVRAAREAEKKGEKIEVISPAYRDAEKAIQEKSEARKKAARKIKDKPKKVKESEPFEVLIEQGVSAKNIGKIKGMTEQQVVDKAAELGLEIQEQVPIHMAHAPSEPGISETESRRLDAVASINDRADDEWGGGVDLPDDSTMDDSPVDTRSVERQVLDAVDEGMANVDIVKQLGVSRQKVASIIKRRAEIEEMV